MCPPRLLHSGQAVARLAIAISLAMLSGCADPVEQPTGAEPRPVGEAEYGRLLAADSGSSLSAARLAALAADAETRIEARMDRVAFSIRQGEDWRPVFHEIRRDHPETTAEVLDAYRDEVAESATFVSERDWLTLPPLKPGVVEAQSGIVRRNFSLALYLNGSLGIITASGEEPDPAYLANHCRVCIPPLAVHEAYPGHHVAFYHAAIHRAGATLGDTVEISGQPENFFFHEGWGLYGELLMLGAGYYDDPERELAAWRMLLLRASRARVDALLHGGEITTDEAIRDYQDLLLMDHSAAATEVRRHLGRPTNKATYFVGLLQIQALRRRALAASPDLGLRSFHDRLLAEPRRLTTIAEEEFGIELGELQALDLSM